MTFGSTFTTTLTVDAEGNIVTYDVKTSDGFTAHWQDKTAEANDFIASVPGTNLSNIDSLQYVSGASVTSKALKDALVLVKGYLGGAQ